MVGFQRALGRPPAKAEIFPLNKLVPSPREALQTFSAVVITGGSSGIGKSFIELAAKLEPRLQFCNLSRTVPLIKNEELNLCHIACDLGRPESVAAAAEEVESFLGRALPAGRVLLINNSGFGSYGHFPEPNLFHQLEMIDVNVRGLVDLTGRLLPLLRKRGGVIMNLASTAAFQPTPFMATYGASKAFVLHWSLALNQELKCTGVRSLVVCPGPTATQFFRRAGLKQRSQADSLSMSSEDVVMEALRALAAGRSLVVTGWKNKISAIAGGMTPKRLAAWFAAKVIGRYRLRRVAR
jgi:short-subunit dehydrogenase